MRIGILDDYPSLGNILQMSLQISGHTVQTARTIEDFFSTILSPTLPDLIIVDFLLQANYSGAQVIREVRKIAPTLPAILISAAPLPTLQAATRDLPQIALLQKPFQMASLRAKIQEVLLISANANGISSRQPE